VEWIETTGKTVAEALEAALDRLGVAESDVEVVVLEEPKNAMFGLRRSNARIRARVRPVQARAKRPSRRTAGSSTESRRRGRTPSRTESQAGTAEESARPSTDRNGTAPEGNRPPGGNRNRNRRPQGTHQQSEQGSAGEVSGSDGGGTAEMPPRRRSGPESPSDGTRSTSGRNRSRSRTRGGQSARPNTPNERVIGATGAPKEEEMSIEAQAELAESFVGGVVRCFGLAATVQSDVVDDVIEVAVTGEGLGLLVGPRGATIDALQELTRTAVQHRSDEHTGRIHVDVAGYRARRAAALQDFAQRVAAEVVETGQSQALEPMSAPDRKIVHDAVHDIAGAATTSEGEDPRRYVVIRPAPVASASEDDVDDADDAPDEHAVSEADSDSATSDGRADEYEDDLGEDDDAE